VWQPGNTRTITLTIRRDGLKLLPDGEPLKACATILGGGGPCGSGKLTFEKGAKDGNVKVADVQLTFASRIENMHDSYRAEEVSLLSRAEVLDRVMKDDREVLNRAWTTYTEAGRNVRKLAAASAALEQAVRAAAATPAVRASLQGHARALQAAIREQDLAERRARSVYAAAEITLTDHLNARTIVERRLLTIAANMAPLEFGLTSISLSPRGGDPYYKVELRSSYDELDEVQRQIDELERTLPKLKEQKAQAFQDFLEAQHEAIRLLERLGGATGKVMQVAAGKAAVSGLIHVGDFAKAWLLEGGPAGAFKEVLKKASEASMAAIVDTSGYGDPKDESKIVDGWMQEALDDTFGKTSVKVTLFERSYKELGINPALAGAEHVLDSVRNPLGRRATGSVDAALAWKLKRADFEKKVEAIGKRYQRMGAYQTSMRKKLGAGAGWGAGVGLELVKDFSEKYLTAALDNYERGLWLQAASADQAARLWFAVYRASSSSYYDAKDRYEALLREKAELIRDWDPNKGQLVRRNKAFRLPEDLVITLDVAWPGHPRELPVQVLVNGKLAPQVRYGEFRVPDAELGDPTKLAIEIR
jgi:hypothetical protein